MESIILKIEGDGTPHNPHIAHFMLGEHATNHDHTEFVLGRRCHGLADVEEQGEILKKQIDKAISKAKQTFQR